MAEDVDGGAAVATDGTGASQTSEQGTEQLQAYTPAEMQEMFRIAAREAVDERMAPAWAAVSNRLTRIEQLAPVVEGLVPQLEEVMGTSRDVRRLVKDVLAGRTLDTDQLQALNDAEKLADSQRDNAKRDRERAQQQTEIEALRKGQITVAQLAEIRHNVAWDSALKDAMRQAKAQGFRDFDAVKDAVMANKRYPSANDEFGYEGWKDAAAATIMKLAATRDAEGNVTTSVPAIRGNGGGASDQEFLNKFGAGAIDYTPANIERARKLQTDGMVARA